MGTLCNIDGFFSINFVDRDFTFQSRRTHTHTYRCCITLSGQQTVESENFFAVLILTFFLFTHRKTGEKNTIKVRSKAKATLTHMVALHALMYFVLPAANYIRILCIASERSIIKYLAVFSPLVNFGCCLLDAKKNSNKLRV